MAIFIRNRRFNSWEILGRDVLASSEKLRCVTVKNRQVKRMLQEHIGFCPKLPAGGHSFEPGEKEVYMYKLYIYIYTQHFVLYMYTRTCFAGTQKAVVINNVRLLVGGAV